MVEEGDTNSTKGVEVVLEMEDENGNVRAVTGDSDYSFGIYKKSDATVQVGGTGFIKTFQGSDKVNVNLTFHAQENVVFQGWSWRYAEDPKGTHLNQKGNKIGDYISTPVLQTENGLKKLILTENQSSFTCTYDPTKENKVYVKVKYRVQPNLKKFPSFPDLSYITCIEPKIMPITGKKVTVQESAKMQYDIASSMYLAGMVDPSAKEDGEDRTLLHGSGYKFYNHLLSLYEQVKEKRKAARIVVPIPDHIPGQEGEKIIADPYVVQELKLEKECDRWKVISEAIEGDVL